VTPAAVCFTCSTSVTDCRSCLLLSHAMARICLRGRAQAGAGNFSHVALVVKGAAPLALLSFSSFAPPPSSLAAPVKLATVGAPQPNSSCPCLHLAPMHHLSPLASPCIAEAGHEHRFHHGGSPWPPTSTSPWLGCDRAPPSSLFVVLASLRTGDAHRLVA
jgi:hypothetical protein